MKTPWMSLIDSAWKTPRWANGESHWGIAALSNRLGNLLAQKHSTFLWNPRCSTCRHQFWDHFCTFFCNEMSRGNESVGNPVHAADLDEPPLWPGRRLFLALCHCLVRTVDMFAKHKCLQSQHISWGCVWKTIQKRSQHSTPPCAFNCCIFFTQYGVWVFFWGGSCVCFPTFAVFSAKNCHVFRCFNPSGPCSSVIRGSAHAKKKTAGREVHHSILKSWCIYCI